MTDTWAIIASGPSLTQDQCTAASRHRTIVVNTSWRMLPTADILFAGDLVWWQQNIEDLTGDFERWTVSNIAAVAHGLNLLTPIKNASNSGINAIRLAIQKGAKRILLLGFDCTVARGTHWHGDHLRTKNPDAKKCAKWLREYRSFDSGDTEIINCTPGSAIDCFKRGSIFDY